MKRPRAGADENLPKTRDELLHDLVQRLGQDRATRALVAGLKQDFAAEDEELEHYKQEVDSLLKEISRLSIVTEGHLRTSGSLK
jgi:hypothetical protein